MENLQLIDKYLKNELSESEIEEFNNKLNSDKEFADQFEIISNLKSNLYTIEKQKIKENLKQITTDFEENKGKIIPLKKLYIAAAAIILLIISIPAIRYIINSNNNQPIISEDINDNDSIEKINDNDRNETTLKDTINKSLDKEIKKTIHFKNYVASRFQKPDSTNYGFLPKKIGEFQIQIEIIKSNANTYKYYNNELFLKSSFEFEKIKIYEEVFKDGKSELYLKYEDKLYLIEKTKTYKKLIIYN